MATSVCTCLNYNPQSPKLATPLHKNVSVIGRSNLLLLQKCPQLKSSASKRSNKGSNKDFIVRSVAPEVAGDVLSSISIPGIPGFSLPGDNPWLTGFAGLFIAVPFMIQRLLALTKEVDMAAQTVEKIADTVGKVAEQVDKAAEDIGDALPEGGLKKMVHIVEDLAEETIKDAQQVEDLMDKVEELDDKLEAFLNKQSKGPEKA